MPTPNLGIVYLSSNQSQPEVVENEEKDILDAAVTGLKSIAMSDANYTLSTTGTKPLEWQYSAIKLTGTLTAARDVICPDNVKQYVLINSTTGGFGLQLKTSAGTGITVANGKTAVLMCDGTNVIRLTSDA